MVHTLVEGIGSTPTSTGLFSPSLVFSLFNNSKRLFVMLCPQVIGMVELASLVHGDSASSPVRPESTVPFAPSAVGLVRISTSRFHVHQNPWATLVFFRPSFLLLRHLLSRRTYPVPSLFFLAFFSFPSASGNVLVTTSTWGVLSPRIVRISLRALEFSRTPIPPPE